MSSSSSVQLALGYPPISSVAPSNDFIYVDLKMLRRCLDFDQSGTGTPQLYFVLAAAHNFLAIADILKSKCPLRGAGEGSKERRVFDEVKSQLCKHLKLRVVILEHHLPRTGQSTIDVSESTGLVMDIRNVLSELEACINRIECGGLPEQVYLVNADPLELLLILVCLSERKRVWTLDEFRAVLGKILPTFEAHEQSLYAAAGLPRMLFICLGHGAPRFGMTAQKWHIPGKRRSWAGFYRLKGMFSECRKARIPKDLLVRIEDQSQTAERDLSRFKQKSAKGAISQQKFLDQQKAKEFQGFGRCRSQPGRAFYGAPKNIFKEVGPCRVCFFMFPRDGVTSSQCHEGLHWGASCAEAAGVAECDQPKSFEERIYDQLRADHPNPSSAPADSNNESSPNLRISITYPSTAPSAHLSLGPNHLRPRSRVSFAFPSTSASSRPGESSSSSENGKFEGAISARDIQLQVALGIHPETRSLLTRSQQERGKTNPNSRMQNFPAIIVNTEDSDHGELPVNYNSEVEMYEDADEVHNYDDMYEVSDTEASNFCISPTSIVSEPSNWKEEDNKPRRASCAW